MNKRRLKLALLICAVVITPIVVGLWPASEPRYKGRKLTEWWDRLNSRVHSTQDEWEAAYTDATNAVWAVGTDALPFYVNCFDYRSEPQWYENVRSWVDSKTSGRIWLPQARDRSLYAYVCIEILGSAAAPIVPELAAVSTNNPYTWQYAALSLAVIGPDALPALSNVVATATNFLVRTAALQSVGNLGTDARSISPLLRTLIERTGSGEARELANLSLRVLTEAETNRVTMIPFLIKSLADTNTASGAAFGLARLRDGIPLLLQAVTNDSHQIRSAATAALGMDKLSDHPTIPKIRFDQFNRYFQSQRGFAFEKFLTERTESVLTRYSTNSNAEWRALATNALAHFNMLGADVPAVPSDMDR